MWNQTKSPSQPPYDLLWWLDNLWELQTACKPVERIQRRSAQGLTHNDELLPGLSAFTPEQLFFIPFANTWCFNAKDNRIRKELSNPSDHPFNYHRVIISVINSPDFSNAFHCKPTSKMNPLQNVLSGKIIYYTDISIVIINNLLFIILVILVRHWISLYKSNETVINTFDERHSFVNNVPDFLVW